MATIVPFLRNQSAFEPETVHAMSAAFDEVCRALDLNGDFRARETIAVRVIELARRARRHPPARPRVARGHRRRRAYGRPGPALARAALDERALTRAKSAYSPSAAPPPPGLPAGGGRRCVHACARRGGIPGVTRRGPVPERPPQVHFANRI